MQERALFEINQALDTAKLAARFSADGRVQVRDVLTTETARTIREILGRGTPWGLAYQAGDEGPHALSAEQFAALSPQRRAEIAAQVGRSAGSGGYGFAYAQYRMLEAYLAQTNPGSAHDLLLEHINADPFMDLVRTVTGMPDLVKADAQATLYAPNHFLGLHNDSHVGEGWKIAYVLNLGLDEWKPDWGGYLLFFDADGDVVTGYRPRFNSLNMFAVPQHHAVSYVPPFAPVGRFSITGWFRDK